MSKKNKKYKPKKIEPDLQKPLLQQTKPARDFTLVITAVYFCVVLFGIFHHEMWRDEYQAWLIATNAHSFSELYKNCLYEGHPMLWHVLLYMLTWITNSPIAMQLLHICIATSSVFLFNRFTNFNILQKILFSFGFYSIFEYSLIARSYSLDFILTLIFCTLYKQRQKNIIWLGVILFLLANTSVYGLAISLCLSGILALDFLFNRRTQKWSTISFPKTGLGMMIFIVGVIFSIMQILPEPDNHVQTPLSSLANIGNMKIVLSKIYNAYLLYPEMKVLPNWNANGMMDYVPSELNSHIFISLVLIAATSLILIRNPLALLFYFAGTFGMICLFGLTFLLAPRYIGHFFIILIASIWLSAYLPEQKFRNYLFVKFSEWGKRIKNSFIYLIFGSQVIVGVSIYITDLNMRFSANKDAVKFILEQKLDTLPIVGTIDYAASDFSALLNKPIYYPDRKEYGTFIIWDGKRNPNLNFGQIIQAIDTVLNKKHSQALLILDYQPSYIRDNQKVMLEHEMLSPSIKLDLLNKFENTMVADEVYYVYLAQRVKNSISK